MKKRTRGRATSLEFLYWLEITNQKEELAQDEFFSLYPEKRDAFSLSLVFGVKKMKKN
ncbi:MAG: hypothetical protein AB1297_04795 [bacterium]